MSNQRYSPEFKDEAVRQIVDRGYSVAEVSERLGAQFAWGFEAFGAVGVPWARVGRTGAGQDFRVGYSLFTHRGTPSLELTRSALGREIRLGWAFALRRRAQVAVQVLHGGPGPGEGTDTGFELTFCSIAPGGRPAAASCQALQPPVHLRGAAPSCCSR